VLFDRSCYNRAGVERLMGFCSDDEYAEFLRSCPEFEHILVRSMPARMIFVASSDLCVYWHFERTAVQVCAEVSVSTMPDNQEAIRFYNKLGLVDEAIFLERHLQAS
jgi:hypothetical protein